MQNMGQFKGFVTSCKIYNWILRGGPKADKEKDEGRLGSGKEKWETGWVKSARPQT